MTDKKKKAKTTKTNVGKPKRLTKKQKEEVALIVDKKIETKHSNYSNVKTLQPFLGSQDSNVIPLGPQAGVNSITQGTGDGSRVGNEINITEGKIKFSIIPFPYNSLTNAVPIPQNIVFVVFYDRDDVNSIPTPTSNGDFFQNNNSSVGFSGNLNDIIRDYNEDRYRILFKTMFKLGWAINQANGADANNGQWSNNDYKLNVLNFTYNYTKHLIKNTKFNDNTGNPSTRGLYAMWYSVPCNNSQFGSTQTFAQVIYQTSLKYKDA